MIGTRSKHEVYSRHKIVSVKKIVVDRKHGYGYLKNIVVKRSDQKDYEFMELDFPRLNLNDLEDMYLLKVQGKIHHLDGVDEFDLINALLLYIRRIVIKKRPYTTMGDPKGIMYLNKENQKMLMRFDEVHKFSDGTLNKFSEKLKLMEKDLANVAGAKTDEEIGKLSWRKTKRERRQINFTTSRYVVPTGRVKVPADRYVVPTGKDNVIVSAGRS
ncbi:hypothetical protein Tco_0877204 [Tanacetum coccineum]|uniref:Uncharacterized protein n=1 Tax=Tanacetum coccineum TaxID=301880 RepID=A0ABQ5BXX1_9ASTR